MLMTTKSEVKLQDPGRYLTQLCKHFAHKLNVEISDKAGVVMFYYCKCNMTADDNILTITLSNMKEEHCDEMEGVLADHLKRFAFRENPEVKWFRSAEDNS